MSASLSGTWTCGFLIEAAVTWKKCIIKVAPRVPRDFFLWVLQHARAPVELLLAQGLGNDLPGHPLSVSVAATAWRPCPIPRCHGSGLPRSAKSSLRGGEKRRCQGNRRLAVQRSYEAGKKHFGTASLRNAHKVEQWVGYPKPRRKRLRLFCGRAPSGRPHTLGSL